MSTKEQSPMTEKESVRWRVANAHIDPDNYVFIPAKKQADYLVETDDITKRATKLASEILEDAEVNARMLKMKTYDYVDKILYDMQGKMDELNMKYFGEMYTNLAHTFEEIGTTLNANREEIKNLAYKTQSESRDASEDKE